MRRKKRGDEEGEREEGRDRRREGMRKESGRKGETRKKRGDEEGGGRARLKKRGD